MPKRGGLGVTFDGLDQFMAELRAMPKEVSDEANEILRDAAERAKQEIVAFYPEQTGNLKAGVKVRPMGVGAILMNIAPHALLYEYGTKVRATSRHENRGRMKPTPTFYPIATEHHDAAIDKIGLVIYAHGASSITED